MIEWLEMNKEMELEYELGYEEFDFNEDDLDFEEVFEDDFVVDEEDLKWIESNDSVSLYFKQAAQNPLLTAEDEVRLAKIIEKGRLCVEYFDEELEDGVREELLSEITAGQEAREKMALGNTRLVVSIAKKYMSSGIPFPDLIQDGNEGLMRAVDKYDYTKGFRFSTYATWWIRQKITRSITQRSRLVRFPFHVAERIPRMFVIRDELKSAGLNYSHEAIAQKLTEELKGSRRKDVKFDAATVKEAMLNGDELISLNMMVKNDGAETELGDMVEDASSDVPEEAEGLVRKDLVAEKILDTLPERTRRIFELRWGIEDGVEYTLEEVGVIIGLTRERIRQIEKETLRYLKQNKKLKKAFEELY